MCREKAERTGEKLFPRNLFFIGFMGCGKSTISGKFGELFSMEQVEMDERIEEQAGMKISEIFRVHGEKAFRDKDPQDNRQRQGAQGDAERQPRMVQHPAQPAAIDGDHPFEETLAGPRESVLLAQRFVA